MGAGNVRVLGVDPGKHKCAHALFVDGVLVACDNYDSRSLPLSEPPDVIVVELPRVYPRSPERPNDLIDLTLEAGIIIGLSRAPVVETPAPSTWKGSVPKHIHHGWLAERVPGAVKLVDKVRPPRERHHVWDAIGLGWWFIQGKRRVT